jgi:glycosyltransferase involved in cell wall biosynthesis
VEGTPNVVLEASLLGVFVVATAVGGTGETIVPGVTGEAIDNPTAPKLAHAVLSALRNPAAMQRASTEGPAFVQKRFGLARMLDETISVYHLKPS